MVNINSLKIQESETLRDAMTSINEVGSGFILVVDENDVFKGILTDGDIRREILKGTSLTTPVHDLVKEGKTADESMSKEEISSILNFAIRFVPILNKDKKVIDVAILSTTFLEEEKSRKVVFLNHEKNPTIKPIHNVLLIGGAGYIGSILTRKLLDKGYNVRIFDKFIYGSGSLESVKDHKQLEIVEGDTKRIDELLKAFRDMDVVIHLAELVGDPACSHDGLLTHETNLFATSLVAQICKYLMINKLVYASSCSVYGAIKNEDELLTEESHLNPVSLYAQTKIEAEKVLMNLMDDNFKPVIMRLGTVFGPSYRMRFDLIVNLLAAQAAQEGEITIFGGDQWRPFIHVEDTANAFIAGIEAPIEKIGGEVFNVTKDDLNIQLKDLIPLYKEAYPEVKVVIEGDMVDPRDYKVSGNKLKNVLGFVPRKSLSEGINEIKALFKDEKVTDYKDDVYSNIKIIKVSFPIKKT
jgi:nucleoside-diphosphate-sugar epimerase